MTLQFVVSPIDEQLPTLRLVKRVEGWINHSNYHNPSECMGHARATERSMWVGLGAWGDVRATTCVACEGKEGAPKFVILFYLLLIISCDISRFGLEIDLDAPKVRIPLIGSEQFVLDLGHFTLHTRVSLSFST